MIFDVFLYVSLAVFVAGCAYRFYGWLVHAVDTPLGNIPLRKRFSALVRGVLGVLFSSRVLGLLKALLLDVLLQRRILRENALRWVMHMCLYGAFMLLLLMHALDYWITERLFEEYGATVNPYLFLRDLFGIVVLLGVGIAVYRRFFLKVPRLRTESKDVYALAILAVIMVSGVFLEGVKMTSYRAYDRMVKEYADSDDAEELKALEAYWVKNFGVVSPRAGQLDGLELLEQGKELHEMSCASCHDAPSWAFSGYVVAAAARPIALFLDRVKAPELLWYLHILACFFGLAYLPFSKMFHIIATPLSLLANEAMEPQRSDPANVLTRQAMELDACTRCGTCSLRCSAVVMAEKLGNRYLLPGEKMAALKDWVAGKALSQEARAAVEEGVYLCTNCDRCTVVCPSGINLRELWLGVKTHLLQEGFARPFVLSPFSFAVSLPESTPGQRPRGLAAESAKAQVGRRAGGEPATGPIRLGRDHRQRRLRAQMASSFSFCFGCQACTASCPVVGAHERPEEALDLLPHQIMCSLALGLEERASSARMIWDCLTCYKCQEYCPQNVRIADIFFALKNEAAGTQAA